MAIGHRHLAERVAKNQVDQYLRVKPLHLPLVGGLHGGGTELLQGTKAERRRQARANVSSRIVMRRGPCRMARTPDSRCLKA